MSYYNQRGLEELDMVRLEGSESTRSHGVRQKGTTSYTLSNYHILESFGTINMRLYKNSNLTLF